MNAYRKSSSGAPPGYFAWEAAGLRWLAAAGAAAVVEVVDVTDTHLDLVRLASVRPTREHAAAFGAALARTHAAGAVAFGSGPDGWPGAGFFGPLHEPLPMSLTPTGSWGSFYAGQRLRPMTAEATRRGEFGPAEARLLDRVADRVAAGEFDTDDPPARIHGDLWSGNLLWTATGAVLIDPAAHGGHREADLAMLALFGAPELPRILDAYDAEWPLQEGWRTRQALHQLYPLLAHVVLFGSGYTGQTLEAARRYG